MKKYKATGCARFFLVMLILAPLAYIGASYYNGQDPIENIKGLFGSSDSNSEQRTYTPPPSESNGNDEANRRQDDGESAELETLRKANKDLADENKALKIQIDALKKEVEMLKNPPAEDQ